MKNNITLLILPIVLICNYYNAQFNTLTPKIPPKKEPVNLHENSNIEADAENKKTKSWKEIIKSISKSNLKKELDSIKTIMKNLDENSMKNTEIQRLKDSLFLVSQKMILQNQQVIFNKSNQQKPEVFDRIDEPVSMSKIVMPIRNQLKIVSSYGMRTHPIFGNKKMHNGIDIKANFENVYAVLDGEISAAGWDNNGGGHYIKVKHYNRFETSYLHLSELYYKMGEKVKAGFIIAKSGNSGNSTAPHLHFSVKEFGLNINPSHFLNDLIKATNLIAIK